MHMACPASEGRMIRCACVAQQDVQGVVRAGDYPRHCFCFKHGSGKFWRCQYMAEDTKHKGNDGTLAIELGISTACAACRLGCGS